MGAETKDEGLPANGRPPIDGSLPADESQTTDGSGAERDLGRMKNEFVSTVSHELRTPLTSIKGYVDLILDGEAGPINDTQREFLTIVKENSDRLVELINELLDISRIESGRVRFKIAPLDMAERIAGAVDTLRTVAESSGHTLVVDAPADLPRAAGDADRVGQVLINFIGNAIKYSPDGGEVRITATAEPDRLRVRVRDHGIGIAPQDTERLFTKFYRVDNKLTRSIGGTGLGLSIVHSIVTLLGGEVGVKSAPGEGSTFWFTLPLATAELVRTPGVKGPGHTGGTVLVVDDNAEVAALIETYLGKAGYATRRAATAREGFELAVAETPVATVLDVLVEDGRGFELLRKLKNTPMTARIPVLVLSTACDEGHSERLGADGYLEKPIDRARLLGVIDDLVGQERSPVVLVADDDRAINALICDALRAKGYAVIAAYDGREAMAAVRAEHPHAVLLDLRMPDMDGYEVLMRLRAEPATRQLPVVVMSAYSIDPERAGALALASACIAKPVDGEALLERIQAAVAEARGGGS